MNFPVTTLLNTRFFDFFHYLNSILAKMTADLELTSLLTTDLKRAGQLILKSIQKNKRVSYIPGYWKLIMLLIKNIPWVIYKRMNF